MTHRLSRAKCFLLLSTFGLGVIPASGADRLHQRDAQSAAGPAYRFERGGWTYVHLEGSPSEIGYQHGRLLANEIADLVGVTKVLTAHSTHRNWDFFREAGRKMFWPQIEAEYRDELEGIVKGVASEGVKLDVWDIVALNGSIELPEYYVPWLNKQQRAAAAPHIRPQGRCSAFIATGSYTKDGKIVIAHSNWTNYAVGERWRVIFDIQPEHGHHILMDGEPGVITSQDDFGENDAGLMITETTITQFVGWNPDGIPEFVRSRKALQYASSIDEYAAMLKERNNGGYANDWLIGERKTGQIAYLELGLKNTPMWKAKDGYFISSNFARDPALIKTETDGFNPDNMASSPNARRVTWEKKMAQNKGQIDIAMAEQFLADHDDSYTGKMNPDSRTLCGHIDRDPRGMPEWDDPPYAPDGAVTGKVTDSDLSAQMMLIARAGHPCGEDFIAAPFLAAHPQYGYLQPVLKDMKAGPWTKFAAGEKQ